LREKRMLLIYIKSLLLIITNTEQVSISRRRRAVWKILLDFKNSKFLLYTHMAWNRKKEHF
jgi:hypothetical protein